MNNEMMNYFAAFIIVLLKDSLLLLLLFSLMGISYFIYYRRRGYDFNPSIIAAFSAILIIIGVLMSISGAILLIYSNSNANPQTTINPVIIINNSLLLSNSRDNSTELYSNTSTVPNLSFNFVEQSNVPNLALPSFAIGIVAIGIALLSLGYTNYLNIENQRAIDEMSENCRLRFYFEHKYRELTGVEIAIIGLIWLIVAGVILEFWPQTYFIIILVAVLALIGISLAIYGFHLIKSVKSVS